MPAARRIHLDAMPRGGKARGRRRSSAAVLLALLLPIAGPLAAADPAPGIAHRFVIVDNSKRSRLVLVDQRQPAKGWSVAIPGGSRDLQRLPGDLLLVSHGDGCGEYRLADGARQWSLDRFAGVSSAQRLGNGNTLLAMHGKDGARLVEVDRAGAEVASLPLKGGENLRLVRRLADGNTLIASGNLIEIDPAGAVVARFSVGQGGKAYVGMRLPDGRTLASTGHPSSIREWDADRKHVRDLGGTERFPEVGLDWASGFDRLPNGNLVVTNWTGHLEDKRGPQLVEYAPDGRLVWTWVDRSLVGDATNVLVLDR